MALCWSASSGALQEANTDYGETGYPGFCVPGLAPLFVFASSRSRSPAGAGATAARQIEGSATGSCPVRQGARLSDTVIRTRRGSASPLTSATRRSQWASHGASAARTGSRSRDTYSSSWRPFAATGSMSVLPPRPPNDPSEQGASWGESWEDFERIGPFWEDFAAVPPGAEVLVFRSTMLL